MQLRHIQPYTVAIRMNLWIIPVCNDLSLSQSISMHAISLQIPFKGLSIKFSF